MIWCQAFARFSNKAEATWRSFSNKWPIWANSKKRNAIADLKPSNRPRNREPSLKFRFRFFPFFAVFLSVPSCSKSLDNSPVQAQYLHFMEITIIGPHPFERNAEGGLKSRVGTIFPRHRLLVTLPGVHASQRLLFIENLNQKRHAEGLSALDPAEEEREMAESADLFFEPEQILIRPDPSHMRLAFEADELLQNLV